MRFPKGLLLFVSIVSISAQTLEERQVAQARADVDRVRGLVSSGVLPPADLEKSQSALADAEDAAILRRDIYQQDLTEAQADELVAAAGRQFERRKKAFDDAKKLVE